MLDLLVLRNTEGIEHAHQLVGTEETHQVILKGDIEAGLTRVTLTSCTSAELVIDTSGLVALCTDDL